MIPISKSPSTFRILSRESVNGESPFNRNKKRFTTGLPLKTKLSKFIRGSKFLETQKKLADDRIGTKDEILLGKSSEDILEVIHH